MSDRERKAASEELGHDSYKVQGSTPADDVLRDAAERAKKAGAKDIDTVAIEGDAVDELINAVDKHKADLVVVGNRGLNSLAGRLLGSVPANISHRAGCDVLIVSTTGRSKR